MDLIKLANVKVQLIRRGQTLQGILHITTSFLIFIDNNQENEQWIGYPLIQTVERRPHSIGGFSALRIRCRDFVFLTFNFAREQDCASVFESTRNLTCVTKIEKVYAFDWINKCPKAEGSIDGWSLYSAEKEFARQGLGTTYPQWRFTALNQDYTLCPTYPAKLVIPKSVSDNVVSYGAKYRSKGRIPALTYIHALNGCTITRASQPMVGLKQNRSLQDEKLVLSIFESNAQRPDVYGATAAGHLIVDARPTANAMANVALGAGTENMDHYPIAKKVYLGIENIHVMRDSLAKVVEAIKDSDLTPLPPNKELLQKSNWLKHISQVLDGASIVANTIQLGGSHVLVHCSDGWDRTSQLCSLAQLTLDPYYRTIEGFIVLIEKDWLSFGHRFAERSGHLASEKSFLNNASNSPDYPPEETKSRSSAFSHLSKKLGEVKFGNSQSHLKYTSPIFHQFLDCVYQLLTQFPTHFEFNERFLRRLLYHTYSCQYGTFLHNSEQERVHAKASTRTKSVWSHFLAKREIYENAKYVEGPWIQVDTSAIKWWSSLFNRSDEEMNGVSAGAGEAVPVILE